MQLTLNNEDVQVLQSALQAYLPDLRREVARTDLPRRDLREALHKREALFNRLIAALGTASAGAGAGMSH
jgi:hypothetical protein